MSTDHTSESSWKAAADSADQQSFVVPTFDDDVAVGADHESVQDQSRPNSNEHLDLEPDDEDFESDLEQELRQELEQEAFEAQDDETASQSLRDSLQRSDIDSVEFRVIRPGTPVRRLRLTGNRYTFGSAEGCSIRLNDRDLRPMHAVLIREASRILVRAYSVPLELNGTRITEAELHAGDVLKLGAYQFELLDADQAGARYGQSAAESARPFRSIFDHPGSETFDNASSSERRVGFGPSLSSADDVIWKERLRREIEQWRERQLECDRRENRCSEREAKLRDRETELWSRAENLYRRETRLQSQEVATFELYDEFNKHQQEMIQMRQAAHTRQESFHQREIAFRNQEIEYRRRLDEATRQLHLSQEQAETATQAVQRMRDQFDSLNQQIEELSHQHTLIELREQQQRTEHARLLEEMQTARDKAVAGQTESEARQRDAESRLEELQVHLASLNDDRGSDLVAYQERLAESERAAKELRQQVQELQQNLSEATAESARLRTDYEEAFASVVQLESMIAKTSENDDKDRETWESEADQLRASVERLSTELKKATEDLSELRDANAQLTARLDDMQRQRDEAQADADARPTPEAFQSLEEELTNTTNQLSQIRNDYEESLHQLSEVQRQRELEQERAAEALADARAAAEANRVSQTPATPIATNGVSDQNDRPNVEAIDQFDPEPDFVQDEANAQLSEDSNEFIIEADESEDSTPWNLETPEPAAKDNDIESVWDQSDWDETEANHQPEAHQSEADEVFGGSLANMLIHDLDEEAKRQSQEPESHSIDDESDTTLKTEEPNEGWDQERNEEAFATNWSNDPAGYRVEEIEEIEETFEDLETDPIQADHQAQTATENQPEEDAEDSIEAYMNRLLRRVQGQPLEDPQPAKPVVSKNLPEKKEEDVTKPEQPVERLDPNAPLIPRSQAPEKATSLSAMRALANNSARIAISRSVRVQTRDTQIKGTVSFACATGAIVCGIACYFFIPGIMRYLAVAMTVLVASIYIREGWLLFRDASRRLKTAALGQLDADSNDISDSNDSDSESEVSEAEEQTA